MAHHGPQRSGCRSEPNDLISARSTSGHNPLCFFFLFSMQLEFYDGVGVKVTIFLV